MASRFGGLIFFSRIVAAIHLQLFDGLILEHKGSSFRRMCHSCCTPSRRPYSRLQLPFRCCHPITTLPISPPLSSGFSKMSCSALIAAFHLKHSVYAFVWVHIWPQQNINPMKGVVWWRNGWQIRTVRCLLLSRVESLHFSSFSMTF